MEYFMMPSYLIQQGTYIYVYVHVLPVFMYMYMYYYSRGWLCFPSKIRIVEAILM